ncbi:SRPBCC family protein [Lewinella sp. IMCC34183]|uniref:SRPBCC family protein n=1 Tax=Lewinella sp. IMCC34183 TaxID=2248762 RepID=UPI000E27E645|nr:SRPBCC domain-containing protein [Lewinella sp. IMCC34183]
MSNTNNDPQSPANGQNRAIYVVYALAAPPEQVWRALTEPELLEQWLFPNDIVPQVDHPFSFRTTPAPGFDGTIRCEVRAVVPHLYLVYSWNSGPVQTVVNFTLDAPTDGSTRLTLLHTGFGPKDGAIYDLLEKGWRVRSGGLLQEVVASLQDTAAGN